MENKYKYYMRKYGTADDASVPIIDLESYFEGMVIRNVSGLSSRGAPKNVYKETYAETSEVRVYMPETVAKEATDVVINASFVGNERRDVYDDFCNYVSQGKIKYWDTVRNRLVHIILNAVIELDDDSLIGNEPFMTAEFKFMNIFGTSEKAAEEGFILTESESCILLES